MQTVDIYIDTSIKGPKRRHGTYMYIIAMQTDKGTADVGNMDSVSDTTENHITLLALEAALKRIKKPCYLIIHLECSYVAAVLRNGWYKAWQENGWKTNRKTDVQDVEKWRAILKSLNEHAFEVRLKEPHTYREWMSRTLSEKENENV